MQSQSKRLVDEEEKNEAIEDTWTNETLFQMQIEIAYVKYSIHSIPRDRAQCLEKN